MSGLAVVGLLVLIIGGAALLALRLRPRQDSGVASFQRHIDALSPEARREVKDRARRRDAERRGRSESDPLEGEDGA